MTDAVEMRAEEFSGREVNSRAVSAAVGTTVGFLVGPGSTIAPPIGLFMIPVATAFGLGRAGFPLVMLMVSIFAGTISPLAGRAIDRFGVRRVIIPAVLLAGLAQIALATTGGSRASFIAVMIAVGVLAGVQNPVGYTRVLALWFRRRRGFMTSLSAAIGAGGGGVIVPQLVDRCIANGGWKLGYAGLGIFILLGVPLLIWLLYEPAVKTAHASISTPAMDLPGVTLKQSVKSRTFWMILIALVAASSSLVALSVHVPAWIADAGGASQTAAAYLSLLALGSIFGQMGSGFLLDRIHTAKIGAPFFLAAAFGVSLLRVLPPTSPWIPLSGFLGGMGLGAELGLASYLVSRYFGLRSYGQIYGSIYGAMVVAAGAGPVIMGIAFEVSKAYLPSFTFAAAALALSFVLIALLPKYVYAVGGGAAGR